jgi:predicted secreted Zn-dependent protease
MQSSIPSSLGKLSWRVARQCNGGSCVQVAASGDMIVIGDSKFPDGPVLAYSHSEWSTFVEGVRQGDFDDLA